MDDRQSLVGAAEIGEMLGGVSRQYVSQLAAGPGFPKPVAVLAQGRVWRRADVARWVREQNQSLLGGGDAPE